MNAKTIFTAMLPEHLLLVGIVLLLVLEITGARRGSLVLSMIVTIGAAIAAAALAASGYTASPFAGQFTVNPMALTAKAVVLALTVPVVMLAKEDFGDEGPFYPLLLASLYGFCLLMSADTFLTLFLGLEIMSIPVYTLVLLAFNRPESAEAALKYLILGGTATALFLMGVSLLYGGTGSLTLASFAVATSSKDVLQVTAVVLVFVAFFLKAAIVPFHTWAPDAYEGASLSVTAFMSTIIKAGVVLAALRLIGTAPMSPLLVDLMVILPLVSIIWGNLTAMRQTSFRRMIAYSSIAHAGYLFFAFLGDGPGRFQAVAFYLIAYCAVNVLAFAVIPPGKDDTARDNLDVMKGLFHRSPFAALMIGMAMLSLAGIPPFPGFIGKFLIFKNVIAAGYTTYAVLGLIGSYLGIYFYLRVIQYMFMSPSQVVVADDAKPAGVLAIYAGVACLVATMAVAVFPGYFIGLL